MAVNGEHNSIEDEKSSMTGEGRIHNMDLQGTDREIRKATFGEHARSKGGLLLLVYVTTMCYGIKTDILGPTLVDMSRLTNSTESTFALVFTFSAVMAFVGGVVLNPLHDRINSHLLMSLGLVMMGVFTAVSPWTSDVVLFICLHAPSFMFLPVCMTGCLIILTTISQNPRYIAMFLQVEGLIYAAGKALAPLIAIPLLSEKPREFLNTTLDGVDIHLVDNTSSTSVLRQNGNGTPSYSGIDPNSRESVGNFSTLPRKFHSNAPYVYVIFSAIAATTAVLHLCCVFRSKNGIIKKKDKKKDELNAARCQNTSNLNRCTRQWRAAYYACAMVWNFFFVGLEQGFSAYAFTFANVYLGMDKTSSATLHSLFEIGGVVSSFLVIFLTLKFDALYILIFNSVIAVLSAVLSCVLVDRYPEFMWIFSTSLGMAVHPMNGLQLAYSNQIVGTSGKFHAVFQSGAYTSFAVLLLLIGVMFEKVHPRSFLYVILICTLFCFLTVILQIMLAGMMRRNYPEHPHVQTDTLTLDTNDTPAVAAEKLADNEYT